MTKYSLFSTTQFGFRKKFSTKDALLYATEHCRTDISSGKTVSLALLDLSKAFDSISHEILRIKLTNLGFSVQSISLILNYLTNRQQKVLVNNMESDWYAVKKRCSARNGIGSIIISSLCKRHELNCYSWLPLRTIC